MTLPEFEHPSRMLLLLIIPALVLAYLLLLRRRNRKGMRFTNTGMLDLVMPRPSQWRRHLAVAMALLSLITLTAAFAKPIGLADVPRERATVVVVLDISQSMAAADVSPTRIEAAKLAATEFVLGMPDQYNVSLVALSGNPGVIVPPTTNHRAVETAINGLELRDSTAVGEAIVVALQALDQAPKGKDDSPAPGAIVLLSDGGTTAGRPAVQGAAEAAAAKVPVHTIAYGTENGYVDLDGKREPVPVDHNEMRSIAERTGASYHSAGSAEELSQVYAELRSEVGYEKVRREITSQFALYAMAFAAVAALAAMSLSLRWP